MSRNFTAGSWTQISTTKLTMSANLDHIYNIYANVFNLILCNISKSKFYIFLYKFIVFQKVSNMRLV